MKTIYRENSKEEGAGKSSLRMMACMALFFFMMTAAVTSVSGQAVLFDFDNAPLQTSLPINLTVSGITANFSATGQGYSIQAANVLGFVPAGFSGRVVYPNSIYLADLLVRFDQALTDFSIMYSCQELGCDDAATMRVTAFRGGSFVGTNTKTTAHPGTWPSDTLACSFPAGFDSVVVHYASPPPTCQDYGVIFMADNMRVTPSIPASTADVEIFTGVSVTPNPVTNSALLSFFLVRPGNLQVTVYDLAGRVIKDLYAGKLTTGAHQITWDAKKDAVEGGIYLLTFSSDHFSRSYMLLVAK